MNKTVLLVFTLAFVSMVSGSTNYDTPDYLEFKYDETKTFYVDHSTFSGDSDLRVTLCGQRTSTDDKGGAGLVDYSGNGAEFELNIPNDHLCSVGENTATFERFAEGGSEYEKVGETTVNVIPKGGMDPHIGTNLIAGMTQDTTVDNEAVEFFQLTNDLEGINNNLYNADTGQSYMAYKECQTGFISDCASTVLEEEHTDAILGGVIEASDGASLSNNGGGSFPLNREFDSSIPPDLFIFDELDTMTPVHDQGAFIPEGDIIFAKKPKYSKLGESGFVSDDQSYFFICRDGATMSNGNKEVPQIVSTSPDRETGLMKCDTGDNNWVDADQCNDDLDNDGDDRVDFPGGSVGGDDYDCDDKSDTEYPDTPPDDCKQGAVRKELNVGLGTVTSVVAQYEESDGSCSTDSISSTTNDDVFAHWSANSINSGNYPRTSTCSESSTSGICDDVAYGDYTNVEVAETIPTYQYFEQKFALQDEEKPGFDNFKNFEYDDSEATYPGIGDTSPWTAKYSVEPSLDYSNNELDVEITVEIKGNGSVTDSAYGSARPVIEVSGPVAASDTEIKPDFTKVYNGPDYSTYTETIEGLNYEDVRDQGLTFEPTLWDLYTSSTPSDLDNPDGQGGTETVSRSIEINNFKKAVSTKYVNGSGWRVDKQSLWSAEEKYKSGLDPHSYPGWENKNISESQVYNDADLSNNDQAWDVANAGETNTLVDSRYELGTPEAVFEGGFAAKCDEGEQWQYAEDETGSSEWLCSGNLNWEQLVQLPRVSSDDVIGIQFPAANFMDSSQLENNLGEDYERFRSYPVALTGKESVYGNSMDEVSATCWEGRIDDKSSAAPNEIASSTFSVSDSETTGFFAEVDHSGTYSCEWNFTTSNGQTWSEDSEGSMIEMHNLNAISNSGERKYMITQDVRRNTNGLSYHYDDADQLVNSNPGLTQVSMP